MSLRLSFIYLLVFFLTASASLADEPQAPPSAEPTDSLELIRAIEARLDRDLEKRVARSIAEHQPDPQVRELEDAYHRAVAATPPPVSAPRSVSAVPAAPSP